MKKKEIKVTPELLMTGFEAALECMALDGPLDLEASKLEVPLGIITLKSGTKAQVSIVIETDFDND